MDKEPDIVFFGQKLGKVELFGCDICGGAEATHQLYGKADLEKHKKEAHGVGRG